PGRDHEQPAAAAPRRRSRHEHHLPELRHGLVHWDLLHPHHPGPGGLAAGDPLPWAARTGDTSRCRHPDRLPAPGFGAVATLLGYNPMRPLLGPLLGHLPAARATSLTGRSFFPALIPPAFANGLAVAFDFAIAACLIAALASLLRGKRYVHGEPASAAPAQSTAPARPEPAAPTSAGPARPGSLAHHTADHP